MITYQANRTVFYALTGCEHFSHIYAIDIDVYKDICKKGDYFALIKNKALTIFLKGV